MLFQNLIASLAVVSSALAADTYQIAQLRNRAPGSRADSLDARSLQKRLVAMNANCQTARVNIGTTAAPNMQSKADFILARFTDTLTLANTALNIANDNLQNPAAAAGIDAFTHYFFLPGESTYPGADDHLELFRNTMTVIANQNAYNIHFFCPTEAEQPACVQSLAFTDPARYPRGTQVTITVCPRFFTNAKTKRLLANRPKDNSANSWNRQQILHQFETGGHTLLHELTHVDAIVALAGHTAVNDPEVGLTASLEDDPANINDGARARALRTAVVNAQAQGAFPASLRNPIRNSESYAAAATEYWMRVVGGKTTPITRVL